METEEKTIEFTKLKYQVGIILVEKFLQYNDGKFHTALELNPATHALTEFMDGELASLREQLKQKEEVIRELIPIAEERLRRIVNYDMPDYYKVRSEIQDIIKRAKLLSKQPQ